MSFSKAFPSLALFLSVFASSHAQSSSLPIDDIIAMFETSGMVDFSELQGKLWYGKCFTAHSGIGSSYFFSAFIDTQGPRIKKHYLALRQIWQEEENFLEKNAERVEQLKEIQQEMRQSAPRETKPADHDGRTWSADYYSSRRIEVRKSKADDMLVLLKKDNSGVESACYFYLTRKL